MSFARGERVELVNPARDARKRVIAEAGLKGRVVSPLRNKDQVTGYAIELDESRRTVTVGTEDVRRNS